MPVDCLHPDYEAALPTWKMIRDVLGGEGAIKSQGATYLPQLSDQSVAAYNAYRDRAQFEDLSDRAHKTAIGFLFRKDPVQEFGPELTDFMDDCTMDGQSFYDWLKDTARHALSVGRRGTLVEWDDNNLRPYLAIYEAESIINWKTTKLGSATVLSLLVLHENVPDPLSDPYEHKVIEQWRSYELLRDGAGLPFVQCQIWQKIKDATEGGSLKAITLPGTGPTGSVTQGAEEFVVVKTLLPTRSGTPLARLPFIFHGPNNYLPAIDRAPLEGIARANLSIYRTSADLENGLHMSGLPTLTSKGYGEGAASLPVGSNNAWVSDKEWADAKYVEVTSEFAGLEKAILRKKEGLGELAGKLFTADTKQAAEAYDTVRIRQTGETVTIGNLAIALTQSGSKVLQWAGWWMNRGAAEPEDLAERFHTEMNSEFIEVDIPADKLNALVDAWTKRAISHKTLFFNLQKGELYKPDTEYEDELADIEDDPVTDMPVGGAVGGALAEATAFGGGPPKAGLGPKDKGSPAAVAAAKKKKKAAAAAA